MLSVACRAGLQLERVILTLPLKPPSVLGHLKTEPIYMCLKM